MTQLTPEKGTWQQKFITTLTRSGNVSGSAKAARISRQRAYAHRAEDPDFAAAWDEALSCAVDDLEAEAWRRAKTGTLKPVYHGGKEVGKIREYSDTLLIFLLKGHRPERFGSKVEHSGPGGGPISFRDILVERPPVDDDDQAGDETPSSSLED